MAAPADEVSDALQAIENEDEFEEFEVEGRSCCLHIGRREARSFGVACSKARLVLPQRMLSPARPLPQSGTSPRRIP